MKQLIALLLCLTSLSLIAQSGTQRYSTIGISIDDFQTLVDDPTHGLAIDHFHKNENQLLEFVFSESEIQLLEERNISYEVIIADYKAHFQELVAQSATNRTVNCGLDNFDDGNMGGYHTYDQMVEHINNMQSQFPDFVNIIEIGQSIENRAIYAVKISDNPLVNESDTEGVVYFEAVTHAREPMSLEATLYYMWWLLENMAADEEANYLVNNREIYFTPIVNPDGYVFNEINDPNGGGLWRKNRYDAGNGCFGVDLNRNYPYGWGLDSGSSDNPCSNTFRGNNPLSEPESSSVANFLAEINPAIAFTSHTYGDKFLSPWGYVDSLATYELYAEFVSEFIPPNYDGYGTTAKMLGYTSSGTTRDYLHSTGIPAWTPEIGHSFWESPSNICDRVVEFLKPMKYLTWVSGNYACFHDFTLQNDQVWNGDTIALDIRIKNRGLTKTATDVSVTINTNHPAVSMLTDSVFYNDIEPREFTESINAPFQFELIEDLTPGQLITLRVNVFHNADLSYTKLICVTAGEQNILYQTDFETDNAWLAPALGWDTTFMDAMSGFHSFTDSRYGNYQPNGNPMVVMGEPVDLSAASLPYVTFNAKWALEPDFDYATFLASTNGVNNWIPLPGIHNNGFNEYSENSHWVQERFNLSQFIGEPQLYFALELDADQSVHSDGFYIDDFKVIDYTAPFMVNTTEATTRLSEYQLSPNPSNGESILSFYAPVPFSATLQINSIEGALLSQKSVNISSGSNSIKIDGSLFDSGIYLIQLMTEGEVYSTKMVVVD